MPRICLTGGSGTLGHYLLQAFATDAGADVLSLVRRESPQPPSFPNVRTVRVDFADRAAFRDAVRSFHPDAIVHAAASGMKPAERARWAEMTAFNVDSTLDLLEAAAATPGCHYVYVGTGLAYVPQPRPIAESDPLGSAHPYGACKAAVDLLVRSGAESLGVALTVLRPFSFTGVNDHATRLFPSILQAVADGAPVRLNDARQVRDFCAAEDVADAVRLVLAGRRGTASPGVHVYNLGSGTREPLGTLVARVLGDIGLPAAIEGGDARGESAPMLTADISAAQAALGWRPRVRLSYAVWELARSRFPDLAVVQPAKWL